MRTVARTLDEAEQMIASRQPFRMRGQTDPPTLWAVTEPPNYIGALPPQYADDLATADYVVISYDTPIAWETDGEIALPDVGYSPSTGQHQYVVKGAWKVPGHMRFPASGRELRPAGGGPRRGGIDSWH
jgi:hypothetical protein